MHAAAFAASPAAAARSTPASEDVGRTARGARECLSIRVAGPELAARRTAELPWFDAVLTAADEDGLAGDERLCDLGATTFEDAADRLA
jgi:hypothetical protein